MNTPTIGARVQCPPDRGDRGYPATVEWIDPTVQPAVPGLRPAFVWVHVRRLDGQPGGVWPSHRLGLRIAA